MITVNGECADYAIMKQVQQARLTRPAAKVLPLAKGTRFSTLAADEPLYVVSHGVRATGQLRGITAADLLAWLTHRDLGLPRQFGGIVILSCYGGQGAKPLAREIADGLSGHVAPGTTVAGAKGYSFGTPEFRASGRSSVLSVDLDPFYVADEVDEMSEAWLAHKPTHLGGVLKDLFNCRVDVDKTAAQNIRKALAAGGPAAERELQQRTKAMITDFAKQAKGIEARLKKLVAAVPGGTVEAKADYFTANPTVRDVVDWTKAIDEQYELFKRHYLWTPPGDAFRVEKVA